MFHDVLDKKNAVLVERQNSISSRPSYRTDVRIAKQIIPRRTLKCGRKFMVGDIGIFQFIGICIGGSDDLCKSAHLVATVRSWEYMAGCVWYEASVCKQFLKSIQAFRIWWKSWSHSDSLTKEHCFPYPYIRGYCTLIQQKGFELMFKRSTSINLNCWTTSVKYEYKQSL